MNVKCVQCGGGVELAQLTSVAECSFCSSSLFIHVNGVLLHQRLRRELDEREARRVLRVYDPKARGQLVYYGFWLFERNGRTRMAPADSHLVRDLDEAPALAGSISVFRGDAESSRHAVPPDIPLNSVVDDADLLTARPRLLHVPFYRFGEPGAAFLVDAVRGQMRIYPSAREHASALPYPGQRFIGLTLGFFVAFVLPTLVAKVVAGAVVGLVGYRLLLSGDPAGGRRQP